MSTDPLSALLAGTEPDRVPVALLNSVPFALLIVNVSGVVVFANTSASRIAPAGSEFVGRSIAALSSGFRLFDPATDALVSRDRFPLARALNGEDVPLQGFRLDWASGGRRIWVECGAMPLRSAAGEVTGAVLTLRETTARMERELSLEAANRLHGFVYRENLAGIIHTTVDGRILDCNEAMLRIFGYNSREELFAIRTQQLYYDPAQRDLMLRIIGEKRKLSEYEVCFRRKDGSRCWALLTVRLLDPSAGEFGGSLISTVLDINHRKQQEETLRQSEERFAAFMRHLPGVAFIKDLSGRYVYYNEASWLQFQKRPEDIVGKTDDEIWPEEDAERYRKNDRSVIETARPVEFIEPVAHSDGPHSWLIYKFPIMESGKVVFVGGVGIDITERRILEEQLTQARKMEALGRLAGGVAHDFNNLLTVISGYGQIAIEGVGNTPADKMITYLQEILNSSRRASGLTGQLLAFSRHQAVQPKILDLGDLLRNMERMLQRVIGEHVDLTVKCPHDNVLIRADSHQMEQVIMNLAVNARDAMPLGGSLTLTCDKLAEPIQREDGDPLSVVLEVRDTGVGMDDRTRTRIFDPFFTSKEAGKGTGLGLSTVYGIVSRTKGTITVDSTLGEGTVFRICFPEAAGEPELPVVQTAAANPRGREIVLLVEDEPSVRLLAETILNRQGYRVLVADGGPSAMEIWEQRQGKVDILVTDVIMPQMSGGELAQKLRAANPRLKILFMSGYTDDMLAGHGVLGGETQLIQKPFTADALGRKLRDVLDA